MSASARKKIVEMHEEITKLREQVAAQAAVIERQKEAIAEYLRNPAGDYTEDIMAEALAIPTDSTQILDDVRRAEREKCAKVCESHPDPEYTAVHFDCARLIRAME